jgi:hypothetical protein
VRPGVRPAGLVKAEPGAGAGPGAAQRRRFLPAARSLRRGLVWDYERGLGNARAASRLKLYAQSCLEAVDAMTSHQGGYAATAITIAAPRAMVPAHSAALAARARICASHATTAASPDHLTRGRGNG